MHLKLDEAIFDIFFLGQNSKIWLQITTYGPKLINFLGSLCVFHENNSNVLVRIFFPKIFTQI